MKDIDLEQMEDDLVLISDGESTGALSLYRDKDNRCYGCDTQWRVSSFLSKIDPFVCGWRPGIKSSTCGVEDSWKDV